MRYGKVFGPTGGVADTKTQIGSTYNMRPGGPYAVVEVRVSGAGVVDAKAATAILHVEVAGTDGPFEYAIGSGAGGATLVNVKSAEKVKTQIPVNSGAEVKVYLTASETLADAFVELVFENGAKKAVRSYVSTVGDLTADTLATKTMPAIVVAGQLIQVRVAAGNVVNAKANGIKVALRVGGNDGPFEFVAFSASGGATNSGQGDAEERDLGIPVTSNQIVYVDLTAAESQKDSIVSIAVA